jgi:hypothetical protein
MVRLELAAGLLAAAAVEEVAVVRLPLHLII